YTRTVRTVRREGRKSYFPSTLFDFKIRFGIIDCKNPFSKKEIATYFLSLIKLWHSKFSICFFNDLFVGIIDENLLKFSFYGGMILNVE
ncbi:hypothetical protein, partial [Tetragenococcus halophilus]|uniref:hypothetical protein n=1 Tax=Tetragenococcus halophilus TaxID=51669 RepID=UPI001CA4C0C7